MDQETLNRYADEYIEDNIDGIEVLHAELGLRSRRYRDFSAGFEKGYNLGEYNTAKYYNVPEEERYNKRIAAARKYGKEHCVNDHLGASNFVALYEAYLAAHKDGYKEGYRAGYRRCKAKYVKK